MPIFSIVLTTISTLCAVIQVVIILMSDSASGGAESRHVKESKRRRKVGPQQKFRTRSKWILASAAVSVVSAMGLLIMPEPKFYVTVIAFGLIAFSVSLLFHYAGLARASFQTEEIIYPKGLWQVLFNKIPDYIENADGPYRILLTQVGDFKGNNLLGESAGNKTGKSDTNTEIEGPVEKMKAACSHYRFKDDKTCLYNFEEYTTLESIPYAPETSQMIHGIIIFVGEAESEDEITDEIRVLAAKLPNVPIAYYPCGKSTYPGKAHIPPYTCLKDKRPEDFVDYLIFRHYVRSGYWKKLCNKYHRWLTALLWMGCAALIVGLVSPTARNLIQTRWYPISTPAIYSGNSTTENRSAITFLTKEFFDNYTPEDVKIWHRDSLKRINNIYCMSQGGGTSEGPKGDDSLVEDVLNAHIFLVWAPQDLIPYKVWDSNAKRIWGEYINTDDSYLFKKEGKTYKVRWIKTEEEGKHKEDKKVRIIYSFDGNYAVEVIYNPHQFYFRPIKRAIASKSLFLDLQQYLVAMELLYEVNGNLKKNNGNTHSQDDSQTTSSLDNKDNTDR